MTGIDIIIYAFAVVVLLTILLSVRNFLLRFLSHQQLMITAAIGTPIHELSHAIIHAISGHKIHEVKFFSPNPKNNSLGYVRYSYISKYPHHQIGRTLAGVAPLFGGIACCYAIIRWLMPEGDQLIIFIDHFLNTSASKHALSFIPLIELFGQTYSLHTEVEWHVENLLRTAVSIYLIIAISLHMTPSATDLKAILPGLIILLFSAFCWYYLLPESFNKFSHNLQYYSVHLIAVSVLCVSLAGAYIFALLIFTLIIKTIKRAIA